MRKDYKVGLALGVIFTVLLVVILGIRPRKAPTPAPASQVQPAQPQPAPFVPGPVTQPEPNVPRPEPKIPTIGQPQPQPQQPPVRTHLVREGETLSDISERYYGTPHQWQKIYKANRSVIKDPDHIYPGMKLVIPDYSR